MSFLWPAMLLLLLLVPLCAVLYARMQRGRSAERHGTLGLLQSTSGQTLGARRHIPPALFLAGFAVLLLGLARPQATVSLPRVEGTVMLTFDVSGSMAAEDGDPTRMETAKAAARAFVERQPPGVQIGVAAFSEGGLTVQAPTHDEAAILAAIDRIEPQRGTSLGQGILASLNALAIAEGEMPPRDGSATPTPVPVASNGAAVIVLLSDGENTAPPDPFEAARAAADRGVRIYTVGVGSAAGTTLQLEDFSVFTRLDEATLAQIAQLTEGGYVSAADEPDLGGIYEDLALRLVVEPDAIEVTSLFAGAGILVLLIGGLCSLLWFGRFP
jgi:Ca-activated chloride channel homolog